MTKNPFPAGLDLTRPAAPRWLASPRLRALGFRPSVALKHATGQYMTAGEAYDAATNINKTVADYEQGVPPRGPWAHLCPDRVAVPADSAMAISTWRDAYAGILKDGAREPAHIDDDDVWTLRPSTAFAELAQVTRKDYRNRLDRLIETVAGYPGGRPTDTVDQARAYDDALRTVLSTDILVLLADDQPLQQAYNAVLKISSANNANAMLRVTSAWLAWVSRQKRNGVPVIPYNPVPSLERKRSTGRVVVWSDKELTAFLDLANAEGWASVAFAVEWALELSWSQKDVLALKWNQFRDGRVKGTRSKTGNMTHTTLTDSGRDLLARQLAHFKAMHGETVEPGPDMPVLVTDAIPRRLDRGAAGQPWRSDYFRQIFIQLRDQVDPSIDKTFQDLRDTAITRMKEAGLDDHQIQSRSQHSLAQIRNIMDKHYGLTTLDISDDAAAKLNTRANRKKT